MKKPTIFLIDSEHIDVNVLVLKIERKFNCKIFTFFNIKEVMHYAELAPDIFIIDEKSYINKKDMLEEFINSNHPIEKSRNIQFIIYGEEEIIKEEQTHVNYLEHYNIEYRDIQTRLVKILG